MCRGAPWDPQLLPRAVQTHGFPVKTRGVFFTEMEQTVLKFVWNRQGPQRARAVLREGRDWRHHAPRFQAVPRGTELEEARPCRAGLKPHRGRSAEQTWEPSGKPGVKGRSTYNRGAETTPLTKISEWITDLASLTSVLFDGSSPPLLCSSREKQQRR